MPMEHDKYESILNELYGETTPDRRTELLQLLRTDYSKVIEDHTSYTTKIGDLEKDNKGLQIANGQLFRQIGFDGAPPEEKEKEKQKTFSESITIEALEGNE
jgi:hypothetical protein